MRLVHEEAASVRRTGDLRSQGKQILYLLDDAYIKMHGLVVEIGCQTRKADGAWGRPKDKPSGTIPRLCLRTRTTAGSWNTCWAHPAPLWLRLRRTHGSFQPYCRPGPRSASADVPHRPLPAPAIRQGRYHAAAVGRDIPWDLSIEVHNQAQPPAYVVEGWLQRGQERLALSEPRALFRGGSYCCRTLSGATSVRIPSDGSSRCAATAL